MNDDTFKIGCRVRIVDKNTEKFGMEGEVTALAMNGAIIKFPDGKGTIVQFKHLEHVES